MHESDELKNDYEFRNEPYEEIKDTEKIERSSKARFSRNTDEEKKIVHQSDEFRNEASEEIEMTEKAERSSKTNIMGNTDENQKKVDKEYTSNEGLYEKDRQIS